MNDYKSCWADVAYAVYKSIAILFRALTRNPLSRNIRHI